MAETSAHGAIRSESSGSDRRDRAKRSRPPPPPMGPRDVISALPDAVIHHVFSFLPLEDVVKTGVLSKRWQSTWTTTAHLVFDDLRPRRLETYYPDFPSLVDSVLIRCTSPAVRRLHITISKHYEAYWPDLDLWLRRVEDLCLRLDAQQEFFYKPPRFLFCLSRLEPLSFVGYCC